MKVNLFLLGTQKCGTTSLAELLGSHPAMFCPPNKETYFFCDEAMFARGPEWFHQEFYSSKAARHAEWNIDATPFYLASEEALRRIAAYAGPETRFIAILRDPVSRALSAHAHQVRLGNEALDFDEALDAEPARIAEARAAGGRWWRHAYVEVGRYGEQLERAMAILGRDRLLVLHQRDLGDMPALEARLAAFLGLTQPFPPQDQVHANPGSMPRSALLSKLFTSNNPVKRIGRWLMPRDLRARLTLAIHKRNLRPAPKPVMSAATRARLEAEFAADQARLARLLGAD